MVAAVGMGMTMAKILVVDDDVQVREFINRVLLVDGHEVCQAPDGRVAVDICHRHLPDLMVIDLIMPDKEGLETIRELRREYPAMRILAISGGGLAGTDSYLRLAQRLGADDIMAKPMLSDDLRKTVGELLRQSPIASGQ